jgi:tRNA(adenine34) deaminase
MIASAVANAHGRLRRLSAAFRQESDRVSDVRAALARRWDSPVFRRAVQSTKNVATDHSMMARCIELSRNGIAEGEYPFGSLIARGETIIAEATNRVMRETDESRHAEIIAIAHARRTLRKKSLRECTLYTTVEPCAMCSFCIRAAGIGRVVYALRSPVLGGISRWDILRDKTLRRRLPLLFNAAPEIVTGVRAEEAQQVWADWNPLFWWAIKQLGFFVLP